MNECVLCIYVTGGWGHDEHKDERYNEQNNEQKEHDWLDEKKKHQMEIGGGILGALGKDNPSSVQQYDLTDMVIQFLRSS